MNLSYRKQGLSKAAKRRLALLITLFSVSLIGFIIYFNIESQIFTSEEIKKATLPTLTVSSQGEEYGDYFGYVVPLDVGRVRNGLIPLDASREITYNINTFGNNVSDITYEITTGDGNRKIASGKALEIEKDGQILHTTISLSNLIDEGREYMMIIRLKNDERNVEYYTRVKYIADGREKECIDFAKYFMETALSENYEELATYIEPKEAKNEKGVSHITINSSLDEVGWQGFIHSSYTQPAIYFAEIDSNYTTIMLDYYITGDKGNNPGTFAVSEYYRMRKGEERIYLLDFERNITQLLTQESLKLEENKLILGQNAYDVEYVSNNTGSNIAFVWDGALYEYNATKNTFTGVFNFGEKDINDPRTTHVENDIDILSIDENGKISYTVYGYMNAGAHEGVCGVGLYHYDPTEDLTTEQAFIATNHSYTSLTAGFDGEIYLSSGGYLYVNIEDDLVRLNQSEGTIDRIMSKHGRTSYALSEQGRYLAYTNEEGSKITLLDLFTEKRRELSLDGDKRYRVAAFIGEDLVYGIIPKEMYTEESINNNIYPMEEVVIVDISSAENKILKSYKKDNRYITAISRESNYILNLKLSTYIDDGVFKYIESDTIQNTLALKEDAVKVVMVGDDKIRQYAIEINDKLSTDKTKAVTVNNANSFSINYYDGPVKNPVFNVEQDTIRYYAYRGMDIVGSGDYPQEAIEKAFKGAGYCVDSDGNYIWQYGRGNTKKSMDIDQTSTAGKFRVNLVGCTLEEILSYVYRENPVYLNEGENDELIIIGYDEKNIYYIQKGNPEEQTVSLEKAVDMIESVGNRLSTYIIK